MEWVSCGFVLRRWNTMDNPKQKCEIDLIQFCLTKNYIIKNKTISVMEGEEKREKFHTFLVSDDSG